MTTSHWDTFLYGFFFGAGWTVASWAWASTWVAVGVIQKRFK